MFAVASCATLAVFGISTVIADANRHAVQAALVVGALGVGARIATDMWLHTQLPPVYYTLFAGGLGALVLLVRPVRLIRAAPIILALCIYGSVRDHAAAHFTHIVAYPAGLGSYVADAIGGWLVPLVVALYAYAPVIATLMRSTRAEPDCIHTSNV